MESVLQPTVEHRRESQAAARQRQNRRERFLLVLTLAVVLLAWLYGYFAAGSDVAPLVSRVLPAAAQITQRGDLFVGTDAAGAVVGYAATAAAPGYGGPVEVLVGLTPDGSITGVEIVAQRESPGFFRLVENSGLVPGYAGRHMTEPLQLGTDLDAVSGATLSAEGVANAVHAAVRTAAAEGLDTTLSAPAQPIRFGVPEVVLLLLFASAYYAHRLRNATLKRRLRWGTLITGMVVLGFVYTAPLTITMVAALLSGYWPDWHTHLYWYLLIGGILFVTTVDAKNPYCTWFCPFGAFQECLAALSKAKTYRPRRFNAPLKWVQRGLALTAIVLGLALRQPGVAGYEPFATLFDLRGSLAQWALLLMIVLAALLMHRPFCNYLCPLDPVVDFIAAGRRWIKELWTTWRSSPAKN